MKKVDFNNRLREYVRANISPNEDDRRFVSTVYESFKQVLNNQCIQIGSYPRFTAIRPLHDLDILYLLGAWDMYSHDPSEMLKALHHRMKEEFENPTSYDLTISLQTHSISVSFIQSGEEVFAVDVVPAYSQGTNEFGQDKYMVPELLRRKHGENRRALYETLTKEHMQMQWIASDPRGYIQTS